MLWFRFSASVKDVCKAPRDQLDRCALLLWLCIEVEKVTKVPEHGTIYKKMAETLVDKACRYMRAAADSTKEPDWDSMKRELGLSPILGLLPSNVRDRLREAERKDEEARRQIEKVPKPSKKSDWTTINLIFLGEGRGQRVGEDYKVKRKTPPLALAATVITSKKTGYFPHFYMAEPNPIDKSPADWPADKPTPRMLYVVIDQGRFDFQLKIALQPPIAGNGVFRNIFILPPELIYLKDCAGKLHLAPAGESRFERPVQCMSFHRIDQKRIAGPIPCTRWSEAFDHLLGANKDDWIIKLVDNAEQDQQSSLTAAVDRTPLAASSLPPNYSFKSPTATSSNSFNTIIRPNTPFNTPIPRTPSTAPIISPTTTYHPPLAHHTVSTFTNATFVSSPAISNSHSSISRPASPPMLVPSLAAVSTSTIIPSSHQTGHTPKTDYASTAATQVNLPRLPVAFGFSPIYKRDGLITRAKNWARKKIDGNYA